MLGVVAVGDVTDLPEKEDEFDTDSESDTDNDTDITFSRFGRTTRAHFRLDLDLDRPRNSSDNRDYSGMEYNQVFLARME